MKRTWVLLVSGVAVCAGAMGARSMLRGDNAGNVLTGKAAFASAETERPGTFRKITVADLPAPYATMSADNHAEVVPRPKDAWPKAPAGFEVQLFATGFNVPRELRMA